VTPLMLAGLPSHLWSVGMEATGIIIGSVVGADVVGRLLGWLVGGTAVGNSVDCTGLGARVLSAMSTFSQTEKPACSMNSMHEANAEQAPLEGLNTANVHKSSNRQAALQYFSVKDRPRLPHIAPRMMTGDPRHRELAGTCDAATILRVGLGVGLGVGVGDSVGDGVGTGVGASEGLVVGLCVGCGVDPEARLKRPPHEDFFVESSVHISTLRYLVLNW